MTELKPCPFCGGKAEIKCILGRDTIMCHECNAKMYSDYTPIEMQIEMWNRRTVTDVQSKFCPECGAKIESHIKTPKRDKPLCDYAVDNGLNPTNTLKTISENIPAITNISNFDNWEHGQTRNLTDKETEIYNSWIEREAKYTGENIMGGDEND